MSLPDLPLSDLTPAMTGGNDKRPTYTIIAVEGGNLPSASSKFVGATPRAAVLKAARRIHKRSGGRTEFDILMRRVSARKVDKKLYKYSVVMKKSARPDGFVTLVAPSFKKVDGTVERNVSKKVRIVSASEHPIYGHVGKDGSLTTGPSPSNEFNVVRSQGTDTLSLVVPSGIPDSVNGISVVKTEWEVSKITDAVISDVERKKHDIAGIAKETADEESKKKINAKKVLIEKRRSKEKADKEKAKETARVRKEKERSKKEAMRIKESERKEKTRTKEKARKEKEREAAKKAASKAKKTAKMTGRGSRAVESPAVESPVVDSPVVESPAVDSPAVDSPAVDSPGSPFVV